MDALTRPAQLRRSLALHALVSGLALTVFVLAAATSVLPAGARQPVADLVLAAGALAAGTVVLLLRRRGHPSTRTAWGCAAGAALSWGGGQLCFGLEGLLTGGVQRPGLSDVGYSLAALFAVRGAVAFPTVAGNRTGRGRALLDGAVVASCALLVTWVLVLEAPGASVSATDLLGLRAAYPVLDCVVATVLVSAAVRLPREHVLPLAAALLGLLVLLVTNLVTFTLSLAGTLGSPEPAEGGYLLGFGLVALGALLQSARRAPSAEVLSRLQLLLPYVGLPPVLAVVVLHPERLTRGPVTLVASLVALVLVRQLVVVKENVDLSAALVSRGRRFEALVHGSADLTLVLDADGGVSWCSPSVERLLDGPCPASLLDLVVEEDLPAVRAALASCAGLQDGLGSELRLRLHDRVVHVHARWTDLRHRREVDGIVLNARDVTESVQARRALADSERRYRRMVETAAEGVYVTDADQVLRFANRRLSELLDVPVEALLGRSEDALLAELVVGPLPAWDRRRGTSTSTCDLTLRGRDGQHRHVRIASSALVDPDGRADGRMSLMTDVTAQVDLEQRLQRDAVTDALTGLGNRRALLDAGQAAWTAQPVAVLYVDLDDFKGVNDSYGHAAGDELLREVTRRLRTCLRPDDLVVRLGGDEFAAVLAGTDDEADAVRTAQRLVEVVQQPVPVPGGQARVGASIGVALAPAGSGVDLPELVQRADVAMYRAKVAGRGRVSAYRPWMSDPSRDAGEVERDLRTALADGQVEVHRQPVA